MNYWYSARPDEIFLDLDSNRATARAFSVLRLAIRQKKLPVQDVYLYPTPTPGHAHMIIVLKRPVHFGDKAAWSLWLGNDRLRVAYMLKRELLGLCHSDLLICKNSIYHRAADWTCECKEKHKEKHVTDNCLAMRLLLGDQRSADYFSRTGKAPTRRKIRVPWGKVALKQIRNWKEVYVRER